MHGQWLVLPLLFLKSGKIAANPPGTHIHIHSPALTKTCSIVEIYGGGDYGFSNRIGHRNSGIILQCAFILFSSQGLWPQRMNFQTGGISFGIWPNEK